MAEDREEIQKIETEITEITEPRRRKGPRPAPPSTPPQKAEKEEVRRKVQEMRQKFNITSEYARCAWYCVGQMGLNSLKSLCAYIDPETRNHARLFGMNTDAAQINGIFEEAAEGNEDLGRWLTLDDRKRFNLIQLGAGKGSGGRPEVAELVFEKHAEGLAQNMDFMDMAVLLGGLGGGTASGVLPKVAEILKKREDKIGAVAIVTMPFGFEAEKRFTRADESRRKISESVPVVTVYNQAIYELGDRPEYADIAAGLSEGDFEEAVHRVNESVISPILRTTNQLIFSERAIFRRDSEDWRRILGGAKAAYIGSYEFQDIENALDQSESILAKLLEDPFQHPEIVPHATVALVLFQGHFTKDEMEEMTEGIKEHMKGGDAAKEVEVIPGYDGRSESKAIFLLAVSPELPDAKKSVAAHRPRNGRLRRMEHAPDSVRAVPPRAETLSPFAAAKPEDLRPTPGSMMRMLHLRFEGLAEPLMVSVPSKVLELVQYFNAHWKNWSTEEFKKNYKLLRDYFAEDNPESRGKSWVPEGLDKPGDAPDLTERKKNLLDSFIPQHMRKSHFGGNNA